MRLQLFVGDFFVVCPPAGKHALELGGNPSIQDVAELETPLGHRIGRESLGGQPCPAPGNSRGSGTLIANWTHMFALESEPFNMFTNSNITVNFLLQSPMKCCLRPVKLLLSYTLRMC